MTELNTLIQLNIELEGLLRILADREDEQARELLARKYADYKAAMDLLLDDKEEDVQPEPVDIVAEAPIYESEPEPEPEPIIVDSTPDPIYEPEPVVVNLQPRKVRVNLGKIITLNDKFRYIREIFNGDERDFNDTIALLTDMDSYTEAEDYLINDMMLDPEAPGVAEFLNLLSHNMPA